MYAKEIRDQPVCNEKKESLSLAALGVTQDRQILVPIQSWDRRSQHLITPACLNPNKVLFLYLSAMQVGSMKTGLGCRNGASLED